MSRNTIEPQNEFNTDTDLVDSLLEEEGGKEKLEMLVRREMSLSTELYQESTISDKITSEHITKYLDSSEKNMENSYQDNQNHRSFIIKITVLGIITILAVIYMLKDNQTVLQYVLTSIVSVIVGAFGGAGIVKNMN